MVKEERVAMVAELFRFGLTFNEIADALEVSSATIVKDVQELREKNDFSERPKKKGELFQYKLYWYARFYYSGDSIKLLIKRSLEKSLNIHQIKECLLQIVMLSRWLSIPSHKPEQKPYIDLMKELWEIPDIEFGSVFQEATDFWIEYLNEIQAGVREDIPNNWDALKYELIKRYGEYCRSKTANAWVDFVPAIIDDLMEKMDKEERHVLREFFGLSGSRKSPQEIANELNKSYERVRQILKRGLRYLRGGARRKILKGLYFSDLVLESISQGPLFQKIREYHDRQREAMSGGETSTILLTLVDYFDFSIRTRNCLKNMDIYFIGEIVQHPKRFFLKTRNFGKVSLEEIEKLLLSHGLSLEMELSQDMKEKIEMKREQYFRSREWL